MVHSSGRRHTWLNFLSTHRLVAHDNWWEGWGICRTRLATHETTGAERVYHVLPRVLATFTDAFFSFGWPNLSVVVVGTTITSREDTTQWLTETRKISLYS